MVFGDKLFDLLERGEGIDCIEHCIYSADRRVEESGEKDEHLSGITGSGLASHNNCLRRIAAKDAFDVNGVLPGHPTNELRLK